VTFDLGIVLKLVLAAAGFLLVAHYGTRDRRIVGALLTFPLLNGIALLSSPDPMRVAAAIYPVVIFNSALFWAALSSVGWVPPTGHAFHPNFWLFIRVLVWGGAWGAGAYCITMNDDKVPSSLTWFFGYGVAVVAIIAKSWRPPPKKESKPEGNSRHWADWSVRLGLFVFVFLCLNYAVQTAPDQKWVGMAGSFPLPGIFAIATLSVITQARQLRPIRDTVLLGPILVIPFTWLFAHLAVILPGGQLGTSVGILALIVAWAISFAIVIVGVPVIERQLDDLMAPSS